MTRCQLLARTVVLSAALHVLPASALELLFEPSSSTALPGDSVSLDLRATGLDAGGPDSLGDFEVDVNFDPTALTLVSVVLGDSLGDLNAGQSADFSNGISAPGILNVSQVSLLEPDETSCVFCDGPYLDDIQSGDFVLATLSFDVSALGPGETTRVSLADAVVLGDGFGDFLGLEAMSDAEISNPVPLPAAGWLLLSGLLASAGLRRWRAPT